MRLNWDDEHQCLVQRLTPSRQWFPILGCGFLSGTYILRCPPSPLRRGRPGRRAPPKVSGCLVYLKWHLKCQGHGGCGLLSRGLLSCCCPQQSHCWASVWAAACAENASSKGLDLRNTQLSRSQWNVTSSVQPSLIAPPSHRTKLEAPPPSSLDLFRP